MDIERRHTERRVSPEIARLRAEIEAHELVRDACFAVLPNCPAWGDVPGHIEEMLAALINLRKRHQIDDPHHADLCEHCRMADAAISAAQA